MVNRFKAGPVLCAAIGAVIGFYCLAALFRAGSLGVYGTIALVFIPATVLSALWALDSVPVFCADGGASPGTKQVLPVSRLLRAAGLQTAAFAAGLALGVSAGGAAGTGVSFGLGESAVKGISGVLQEDPRIIKGGRAMAVLSLREVSGAGGVRVSAKGELTVFFPEESALRLRDFGRGSLVFAEGNLRVSDRNGGPERLFSANSMHVVKQAPALERFRTGVRLDIIRHLGDSSWGGLSLALLVGIRDNLDSEFSALYRGAGCSYILALSGMHLAVLAGIIAFLLKKTLGIRAAAGAGAVIIVLYCFIVGPQPSLSRAVIMYLLGTAVVLGALKRDPLSLLGMAFLIQIVIAPRQGYSISFILSYLALAGMLSIGTALNGLFKGKIPGFLLGSLSMSLAAFLSTAGVSAYFFGVLQPGGILAGLIIAPLTTVFMGGSLAWLALDCISPVLSGFLSFPLSLLYSLMEKTASAAGIFPGFTTERPPEVLAVSLALWLFILWFAYRQGRIKNRLASFA